MPEAKYSQRIAEVAEDIVSIVEDDIKMDDFMFDYPLITHPCRSADNSQLAVYNFALKMTQLIKLEDMCILKSVYHSYPDKLREMFKKQDSSLSSLLIIGEV